MGDQNEQDIVQVKLTFNSLLSGETRNHDDVRYVMNWVRKHKTPPENIISPDRETLPFFDSAKVVQQVSADYVRLEKDGFLLGQVRNFKYDSKSYLHSLIFNGVRQNRYNWTASDGFKHAPDKPYVSAMGYEITSKGLGVLRCMPSELNSTDTFTKIAKVAETRSELPNFTNESNLPEFGLDFFNSFSENQVLSDVPYLIFNIRGLYDQMLKRVPRLSDFKFSKIPNILTSLDYGNWPGVWYPYHYYYFNCSLAGWHDEEYSMNSLNVNYGPGYKTWWVVAREHAHDLRELNVKLQKIFGDTVPICRLQHKDENSSQFMIHPGILELANIPYKQVIQKPGVVIVTSSAAMHSVLNIGTGVSVAQNLLIPINYLMNPIEDMCSHYKENFNELVDIKIKALINVAKNPPTDFEPSFEDFNDVPIRNTCKTEDYIGTLIKVFKHLKIRGRSFKPCEASEDCEFCLKRSSIRFRHENTEHGIKFACFALRRLIKLSGLEVNFDYVADCSFSLPNYKSPISHDVPDLNSSFHEFTTGEIGDDQPNDLESAVPIPGKFICPKNLEQYITMPVLYSELTRFGDLVFKDGIIESCEDTIIFVRKEGGSIIPINICDPSQICSVIRNKVPASFDLNIGDEVLYYFGDKVSHFKVGRLDGILMDTETLYQIEISGTQAKLLCPKNLIRAIKPYWYENMCDVNQCDIPLILPAKPSRKRSAGEMINENLFGHSSKKPKTHDKY